MDEIIIIEMDHKKILKFLCIVYNLKIDTCMVYRREYYSLMSDGELYIMGAFEVMDIWL